MKTIVSRLRCDTNIITGRGRQMNPRSFLIALLLFFSPLVAAESEIAKPLAATTRKADVVVISTISKSGTKELKFSDSKWIEDLARILESSTYTRKEPCACMPRTQIQLYLGKERLESFSIHHGDQLNVSSGGIFGVFSIEASKAKAFIDLINEKKNEGQPSTTENNHSSHMSGRARPHA